MTSDVTPIRRELPWTTDAETPDPEPPGKADLRLWSVTTIIGTQGTPDGLVHWAATRTADAAIEDRDIWTAMVDRGQRGAAMAYLAQARDRPRRGHQLADRDVGTEFHRAAERWAFDGKRPPCHPDVAPLLDSLGLWLERFQPTFVALEMTVYNPDQHYAGTLDGIVNVDGSLYVLDYKASLDPDGDRRKRPWHSVAPQLAAYRHAPHVAVWKARHHEVFSRRYYLLSEDERAMAQPMPQIAGGLCLHVTPWHADLYPVSCGPDVYQHGFLSAVNTAEWVLQLADTAVDFDGAQLLNTA